MPKWLEEKLKAEASKKGYAGEQFNRYVYGTLRKMGWRRKSEGMAEWKRKRGLEKAREDKKARG